MPESHPHASWLRQVESYLKDWSEGPRVCLGDGQTEAEGVPSQCGGGVCPHTPDLYVPEDGLYGHYSITVS